MKNSLWFVVIFTGSVWCVMFANAFGCSTKAEDVTSGRSVPTAIVSTSGTLSGITMGYPAFDSSPSNPLNPALSASASYSGLTLWDYYYAAAISGVAAKGYIGTTEAEVAAKVADRALTERAKRIK